MEGVSSRADLAMRWHNDHNQYTQTGHDKPNLHPGQIDAYTRICSDAKMLARKYAANEAFQGVFYPATGIYEIGYWLRMKNGPLQPLFTSADALLKKLRGIKKDVELRIQTPIMAIAIDKASSFFDKDALKHDGMAREQDSDVVVLNRYVALNRIMSCLWHKSIWMILASTQSQIKNLLPPAHMISHYGGSGHSDCIYGQSYEEAVEVGRQLKQLECLKPFNQFPFNNKR